MRTPPAPPAHHRMFAGAAARRASVYVSAAALVGVAGSAAARFATPGDPHGRIRVFGSPASDRPAAEATRVEWDHEADRGAIDVRESDGVVRRYYMERQNSGENGDSGASGSGDGGIFGPPPDATQQEPAASDEDGDGGYRVWGGDEVPRGSRPGG